jgi:hypothetical protein
MNRKLVWFLRAESLRANNSLLLQEKLIKIIAPQSGAGAT